MAARDGASGRCAKEAIDEQVIQPRDAAYDSSRQVTNVMIERRPGAIVFATDMDDAVATVRRARERENRTNMKAKLARIILTLAVIVSAGLIGTAASADSYPSGQRVNGQTVVEPGYNATNGGLIFLQSSANAAPPTQSKGQAVAPLWIVEYPPNTSFDVPFNCEGVPGNCPDHDGAIAQVATGTLPEVYGTDPALVPGHDHLVAGPGVPGAFQVTREVVEVLFTPKAVRDNAITHLTTKADIDAAVANGYAITIDLGFALRFSVVPSAVYFGGTPVQ